MEINNQKAKTHNFLQLAKRIKSAWIDQVLQNRDITQKVVRIRNMRERKIVTKFWESMLKKTESQRAKIRCIKSVTKIPVKMEYRFTFEKWIGFINSERKLEKKIKEGISYFTQKRQALALGKLVDDHRYSIERKQREDEIVIFYFSKQARQIFVMLREFLGN